MNNDSVYPGDVKTPMLKLRPVQPKEELLDQMVQPEDLGAIISLIAKMPPNVQVSDITVKPVYQNIV